MDLFSANNKTPNPTERLVLSELSSYRGLNSTITVKEMALATGLTERTVRQTASDLVTEHRQRIGSSDSGYYMIESEEDLDRTLARLQNNINKTAKRIASLKKCTLEEVFGQLAFESRQSK